MLDFAFMIDILPQLLKAGVNTLKVSSISLILGTVFGLTGGVLRVIGPRVIYPLLDGIVGLARGTPIAIQIYMAYFLLPLTGIDFSLFQTCVIALLFNTTGYQIEIARAALQSIDFGQIEAAATIGMDKWKAMRYIVVPQAAKRMIPPLTNEFTNLIKASSVLSIIAYYELTKAGESIIQRTYNYAEGLIMIAAIYFIVIQLLTELTKYLEKNVFNFDKPE